MEDKEKVYWSDYIYVGIKYSVASFFMNIFLGIAIVAVGTILSMIFNFVWHII